MFSAPHVQTASVASPEHLGSPLTLREVMTSSQTLFVASSASSFHLLPSRLPLRRLNSQRSQLSRSSSCRHRSTFVFAAAASQSVFGSTLRVEPSSSLIVSSSRPHMPTAFTYFTPLNVNAASRSKQRLQEFLCRRFLLAGTILSSLFVCWFLFWLTLCRSCDLQRFHV